MTSRERGAGQEQCGQRSRKGSGEVQRLGQSTRAVVLFSDAFVECEELVL